MRYLAILCLGLLVGCSSISGFFGDTPAEKMLRIEQSYATAFVLAAQYENLPRCVEGSKPVCSDQSVVDEMRALHTKIKKALDAAWVVVRLAHPKETADTESSLQRVESLMGEAKTLYESVRGIITGAANG